MSGEKRFGIAIPGFNKSDVNSYIEKMLREFDSKLKEKDDEILSLRNQLKEIKMKYEDCLKNSDKSVEDKAKIADVLIKAEEQGKQIIKDAKEKSLAEKKKIEESIEEEKAKIAALKCDITELKDAVEKVLKKCQNGLSEIVSDSEKKNSK